MTPLKLGKAWISLCFVTLLLLPSYTAQAQTVADVVLTLDVSGSIDNGELNQEVQGLINCINAFPQNGTIGVGIVVYADGSAVALPITELTAATLPTIEQALLDLLSDRIVSDVATNIAAGINSARALLNATPTEQDFIFLVGDGASNTDPTQPACDAAAADGITICALAVGSDAAGEAELEACAVATGGHFGIGTFDNFEEICRDCLDDFFIGFCLDPIVNNDPGLCGATVSCEQIVEFRNIFGDVIVPDTLVCNPGDFYAVGVTDVSITATRAGFSPESVTVDCHVTVLDAEAPVIVCREVTVECDGSGNLTDINNWLFNTASDEFGAEASDNCAVVGLSGVVTSVTPGCGGTATYTATFTATDPSGNTSTCEGTLTIEDTTPPMIFCNSPATITPPDAPISFTATAEDVCCLDSVTIIDHECYAFIGSGKRIDKSESCIVEVDGATINIIDVGGVGTFISWTVLAVDCCGNESIQTCTVQAVNPGQNK